MDRRVLFLVGLVLLIAVPAFLLGNDPDAPPPDEASERGVGDREGAPVLRGNEGAVEPGEGAPSGEPTPEDVESVPADAGAQSTAPAFSGVPLTGRVVRASDGTPVVGARVKATEGGQVGTQIALVDRPPLGVATTDQDGVFRFEALPAADICTLTASADGFRTTSVGCFPKDAAGGEGLVLRIERGGRVEGRVFDPDGAPVAGARVCLDLEDSLSATTDAGGLYRIEGLVFEQRYGAIASTDSGLADSEEKEGVFTTEAEPVAVVDLVLRRPGSLVVLLVDADGAPVEVEAEVALGPWPFMGWLAVRDEARGHAWRFESANPGNHRLQIELDGFKRVDRRADVPEGEQAELTVTLGRGDALVGVVVDDRGEPIEGAWVSADDGRGFDVNGKTDAEGRFRLLGLPKGKHTLRVGADGHVPVRIEDVSIAAGALRVELDREAIVVVRLRLPVGTPTPSTAFFWAESADTKAGSGYPWPRGEYQWPVPPGPVTLAIEGEGFALWSRCVDLAPGETVDLGTVALEEGVTLEIRVTDFAGAPVAGADVKMVSVLESWRLFAPSSTDPDGVVRHEHLNPGEHRIQVIADGYLRLVVPVTLPEGGGRTVAVLMRGGLIHGRVRDAEGAPVEDARVRIRESGPDPMESNERTDEVGRFEDRVPPGCYTVAVIVEGKALDTRVVEVTEGGEVEIVFSSD